jgi:hypothetical protein
VPALFWRHQDGEFFRRSNTHAVAIEFENAGAAASQDGHFRPSLHAQFGEPGNILRAALQAGNAALVTGPKLLQRDRSDWLDHSISDPGGRFRLEALLIMRINLNIGILVEWVLENNGRF